MLDCYEIRVIIIIIILWHWKNWVYPFGQYEADSNSINKLIKNYVNL